MTARLFRIFIMLFVLGLAAIFQEGGKYIVYFGSGTPQVGSEPGNTSAAQAVTKVANSLFRFLEGNFVQLLFGQCHSKVVKYDRVIAACITGKCQGVISRREEAKGVFPCVGKGILNQ